MKPGWQSSEFWIAICTQVLALLALSGAINVGDKDKLETALANAVTAVFTIVSSAVVVIRYIRSRSELKSHAQATITDRSPLVVPLILLAAFFLAAPAQAGPPATQPSCLFGRQQRTDPALLATLQQIAQNQQTIIMLLQQRAPTPSAPTPPAPAQPLIIVMPGPQAIPLGGAPRQDIPLGGAPRQDIPLGAAPRQDIPLGGAPRQEIPLGPPPVQQIPLGPAPRQVLPLGENKPLQPPAGEVRPAPAPSALQRYVPR
jgi:hypothetical protein